MPTARKWVLKSHFSGLPKREDLEIVEEELPPIKDGEFLCEAQWWSVDPYMRVFAGNLKPGEGMIGQQIARVTESKNADFAVGDVVSGFLGWRTHTVTDGKTGLPYPIVKIDPSTPSLSLGILGVPGVTAYFGFLELCQPKEGETLVVNGAAGAVGSAVGQIAKIKGCRVVGYAGTDEKVTYLKRLGFDAVYNYKTMSSLQDTLKEACPNGVDMFFDNVGGEYFDTVLAHMNERGRVSVCGAISTYNLTEEPKARPVSGLILWKQLRVEGFIVTRWISEWPKAFKEIAQWIQEGKMKYDEHVTEGFDHIFDAFLELFTGHITGKAVVKA